MTSNESVAQYPVVLPTKTSQCASNEPPVRPPSPLTVQPLSYTSSLQLGASATRDDILGPSVHQGSTSTGAGGHGLDSFGAAPRRPLKEPSTPLDLECIDLGDPRHRWGRGAGGPQRVILRELEGSMRIRMMSPGSPALSTRYPDTIFTT